LPLGLAIGRQKLPGLSDFPLLPTNAGGSSFVVAVEQQDDLAPSGAEEDPQQDRFRPSANVLAWQSFNFVTDLRGSPADPEFIEPVTESLSVLRVEDIQAAPYEYETDRCGKCCPFLRGKIVGPLPARLAATGIDIKLDVPAFGISHGRGD
jgi:hypothetical protein